MPRFDVYRVPSKRTPLAVDVQADALSVLETRVVVPLSQKVAPRARLPRLNPSISIGGEEWTLLTTEIATLPTARLGQHVANIEREHRDDITAALDAVFTGF